LTFSRAAGTSRGPQTVQYLAGLRDCPSLRCGKDTTIATPCRSVNGTWVAWFSPEAWAEAFEGGVIGAVSNIGFIEPLVRISVNAQHQVQVDCPRDGKSAPLLSKHSVNPGGGPGGRHLHGRRIAGRRRLIATYDTSFYLDWRRSRARPPTASTSPWNWPCW
jgi:hypothetical protein